MGQSWVIWTIWSPQSNFMSGQGDQIRSELSVQQSHEITFYLGLKAFCHH